MNRSLSRTRLLVIEDAVIVEDAVTTLLNKFLGLPDNSKFIRELRFGAKIKLLTEMEIFNDKQESKLVSFSQIRNKFAHNSEAKDFLSCLIQIPKTLDSLHTIYGLGTKKNAIDEKILKKWYKQLRSDVLEILMDSLKVLKRYFLTKNADKDLIRLSEGLSKLCQEEGKTNDEFREKYYDLIAITLENSLNKNYYFETLSLEMKKLSKEKKLQKKQEV